MRVIPSKARLTSRRPHELLFVCGACLVAGCSSHSPRVDNPAAVGERRDTKIVHEACDTDAAGVREVDVNGDGRPDLVRVFQGTVESCRSVDLDFDGSVDVWVYNDPTGKMRRREADFDRDGGIDEIALFRGGELMERHQATTFRRQLDTWHFFEAGKLVRSIRDSNGDGVIDQWWEYPSSDGPRCAKVHADANGDGRPDPGATVDLCGEGQLTPPPASADTDAEQPEPDIPVELSPPPGSPSDVSPPKAPSAADSAVEAETPNPDDVGDSAEVETNPPEETP